MAKLQFPVRSMLLVVVPVALIALAVGHHLRQPRPVPVRGTVTLDGKPLSEVVVRFETSKLYDAEGHPGDIGQSISGAIGTTASGVTDSTGRFQAKTFANV